MKKFLISICLLSICITCITGCSFSASDQEQAQEQASDMVENLTRAADEISQGGILEELEETEGDAVGIEAEDDETQKSEISGQDVELEEDLEGHAYDYTQLSEQEQELYRTILAALQECASDVAIDMVEESSFDKVFQCVMNDHPEIFYVDGYTFIKYTKGDKLKGNAFSGSYLYSQEEIEERNVRIEEKTEEILRQMPDGDEYEKVKYIYEYIIANTEYVQGAEDNQNICSVFLGGRSVCQGYAKAAQYLFEKAGIYSIFVSGKVESGEDHAWNIVRIDGNYYYIDTTWGDASYVMSGRTHPMRVKCHRSIMNISVYRTASFFGHIQWAKSFPFLPVPVWRPIIMCGKGPILHRPIWRKQRICLKRPMRMVLPL